MANPAERPPANGSAPVLVTGGAGYIGSHACKALAEAGYMPVAFDNLVTGHRWAVKWGPLVEGDVTDRAAVETTLSTYQPQAVMHFAAASLVGESVQNPGKYYRTNVLGTLNVLEAMREAGCKRLVLSSSCAVYGTPEVLPITEAEPLAPLSPYGHSKLMCERMVESFCHAHSLTATALRYFNAAGADPMGEIGEVHDPETHLIPLVLDAASGRRAAITVFGDDYETPDGTCVRDYIHVRDLAAAHVAALRTLAEPGRFETFNLGIDRGFSVREVIGTVARVTGLDVPCITGERRPGDPAALVSDASKARQALGWQPEYYDLAPIIETAWAWHQKVPR
ncbi:MAG: UDP-glucose 4-epimerase GalE [Pseudomonadota bacterium]